MQHESRLELRDETIGQKKFQTVDRAQRIWKKSSILQNKFIDFEKNGSSNLEKSSAILEKTSMFLKKVFWFWNNFVYFEERKNK